MTPLFDEFIDDGGLEACRRILEAVRAKEHLPERVIDEFNTNCFDITLHYVDEFALLEDVLDISPDRKQRFDLNAFVQLLVKAESRLAARE